MAAALAVAVTVVGTAQDYSVLEAAGLAALCLPLAVRTRWPLAVLGAVVAGAVAYVGLVRPSEEFTAAMLVAAYTVGVRGSRRRALAVAGGLVPVAILLGLMLSPTGQPLFALILEKLFQLGFALAVGEAVRSRGEYVDAVRDRAEQSARERELEARRRLGEERVRIARDVHDVVAHSIATISTQAAVGMHVGREEPERALEALESIKQVSNRALQDLRHALGTLRDPADEDPARPTPSMHDVPQLVDQARAAGVGVELRMEGAPAELPAALQVAVYRIVQEGLTNVMRHAGGARATVHVRVTAEEVIVEVRDDGSGAPTASSDAGTNSGLAGMRERTGALGGSLQTGVRPGGGFGVRAVMPVDREPA